MKIHMYFHGHFDVHQSYVFLDSVLPNLHNLLSLFFSLFYFWQALMYVSLYTAFEGETVWQNLTNISH